LGDKKQNNSDCGGIIENLAESWRNYNAYKARQFPAKDAKKG